MRGLLPFPVDYAPYAAAKVVQLAALLTFTALGFWLLLAKLGGEPTVTLDSDWLYRRLPGALAGAVAGHAPRGARVRSGPHGAPGPEPAGAGRLGLARLVRYRRLPDALPRALTSTGVLGAVVLVTFVVLLGLSLRP